MLLGKRPRPPMKRTTSMTEITLDLNTSSAACEAPSYAQSVVDPRNPFNVCRQKPEVVGPFGKGGGPQQRQAAPPGSGLDGLDQRFLASMSPRNTSRRHSADFIETAHFLRACSLCKRRLVPGRDIYMYRGDSAFCSSECRQQQMNQDEKKEKCSLASKKQATASNAAAAAGSKGETVAAV